MVVLDNELSKEDFRRLLARISKVSDGATVPSYVENVAKVITVSLSPYAVEIVSIYLIVCHVFIATNAVYIKAHAQNKQLIERSQQLIVVEI